ncbi:MAG: FMN-binding protein, partial [Candidatus Omnitrophica bacterium]|nr:FMN-binding protein [Candidatus Omnitrophota bacterium]
MQKKNIIRVSFLILFLGSIALSLSATRDNDTPLDIDVCRQIYPESQKCVKIQDKDIVYYRAFSFGKDIGTLFFTKDLAPEIKGYGGHINLLAGFSDGAIDGIKIINSSETPSLFSNTEAFLNQFAGKKLSDKFELGNDVEGITRATISSKAVVTSLHKCLGAIKATPSIARYEKNAGLLLLEAIFVPFIIFILAFLSVAYRKSYFRWLALLLSLLYLGIMRNSMLSVIQIANIGLLNIPRFGENPHWFVIILLSLLSILLFGNIY